MQVEVPFFALSSLELSSVLQEASLAQADCMCGSRTGQMNQFVPIIAVLGATGGRFDVYALSAARSWWFMQKVFSPVGAQNLQLVVCIRDHIAFFKHIHTSK